MKKVLLVAGLIILVIITLINMSKPEFDILEFSKSILMVKQDLPLIKMINSQDNTSKNIVEGQSGFVVTGPYWSLPHGKWQVEFEFIPYCQGKNIGYMDVVKSHGADVYAYKDIFAGNDGEGQKEILKFNNNFGNDYEFRVFSNGECQIRFVKGTLIREELNLHDMIKNIYDRFKK